jgi:RNA polymerase sigma factor (TIGR02999 family)
LNGIIPLFQRSGDHAQEVTNSIHCGSVLARDQEPVPSPIPLLMDAFRKGDSGAGARLVDLFYPELKRLAAGQMKGERRDHSWQPTLLVNELYLELVKIKALQPAESDRPNDKAAFFALAGQIMRRLLIHHARPLAQKAEKVPVWEDLQSDSDDSLLEIEDILSRLEDIKPIIRRIVEMKVFEGQTAEEISQQLGCATVTVHRHWQFARHWLRAEWAK